MNKITSSSRRIDTVGCQGLRIDHLQQLLVKMWNRFYQDQSRSPLLSPYKMKLEVLSLFHLHHSIRQCQHLPVKPSWLQCFKWQCNGLKKDKYTHLQTKSRDFDKRYLRADILRSIIPRISESAQIPDFTWKVSFFWGGLESCDDFVLMLLRFPSLMGFCVASFEAESELEVNEPKMSDPTKLFSGTAANGSTMLASAGSNFGAVVSCCTTGSAAKRSTVGEVAGTVAGWEANRSTGSCTNEKRWRGSSFQLNIIKEHVPTPLLTSQIPLWCSTENQIVYIS